MPQAQAARAAEEAERAALSADRQAREEAARRQRSEPVYEEPEQVQEQQPSGGNTWTDADAQARAEGYGDAGLKKAFEEYNEKYGTNIQPVTQEDLDRWGINFDD